jgi:hypothetical protein
VNDDWLYGDVMFSVMMVIFIMALIGILICMGMVAALFVGGVREHLRKSKSR